MIGQVDARTKKRRAAAMLALAADARAAFARAQLGRELRVLFEQPAGGSRWLGHADNYVEVLAASAEPLANQIGLVQVDSIDPDAPDRVVGRLDSVD
jgi:tRNA A37 methylthiotransferase MiaB